MSGKLDTSKRYKLDVDRYVKWVAGKIKTEPKFDRHDLQNAVFIYEHMDTPDWARITCQSPRFSLSTPPEFLSEITL